MLPLLSGWMACALGMIFIAHLASNVLFAAGRLAFSVVFILRKPLRPAVKPGAGKRSAPLFTGIAAAVAAGFGSVAALYAVSSAALLMVALIVRRYRE
jgi:hypothetical protein